MRLRKKWWAVPEMERSSYVIFDGRTHRGAWRGLFETDCPINLELGCGRMKYLLEMAARHPDINFIGVDIVPEALVRGVRKLNESGLTNVRVVVTDIRDIRTVFGAADRIDQIHIYFCNPWPKPRHQKRRLTHPRQLLQYRDFLRDGAQICIKTDDHDLYIDSLDYLAASGFEVTFKTEDLALADDPDGIISDYEAKWRGRGVPIKMIRASKLPDEQVPWRDFAVPVDSVDEKGRTKRDGNESI